MSLALKKTITKTVPMTMKVLLKGPDLKEDISENDIRRYFQKFRNVTNVTTKLGNPRFGKIFTRKIFSRLGTSEDCMTKERHPWPIIEENTASGSN